MASQFDAVRQRNRGVQGREARERVKQRLQNPVQSSVESTSIYNSVRNRPIEQEVPDTTTKISLPREITSNGGLDILKNSPWFKKPIVSEPVKTTQTSIPTSVQRLVNQENKLEKQAQPIPISQREYNQMKRDESDPSNPFWKAVKDNTVDAAADFLDKLRYETKPGQFIDRLGYSAASMVGPTAVPQPSTGVKAADVAADILGGIGGFAVNPGALEQNLMTNTYNIANNALLTKGGQVAQNAISKGLTKANPLLNAQSLNIGANTANKVAENLVRGGIAGAQQNVMQDLSRGEGDIKNLAESALAGAAFGGVGDALLGAAGTGISKLRQSKLKANNTPEIPQLLETPAPVIERPTTSIQPSVNEVNEQAAMEAFNRIPSNRRQLEVKRIEEPEVTAKPDLPINEIEAPKSDLISDLFGNQKVGITPFGSTKSNKILTTEDQLVNNPLKKDLQGFAENTKGTARAGYQNFVDYLQPLKKISREAYDAAMDASRANNLANTIIMDKFVNNQGKVIGNSLRDIISNTGRGNAKAFDDYLIARHAITRLERGEKVYDDALNMTPEKIAQRVATLEQRYPQFKQLGEEWNNYNRNMINNAVEEGLISRKAADAMFEQNPNYAAMRRQFTTSEKLAQPKFGGTGQSFSGQKAPIKEYSPTGSTRRIVSPTRSAMEQAYAFKNAELRNRTMQEIVKSVQLDPDGMKGIVEIVKKPSTSYKSLDDALREGGSEEFIEQLDNDFRSLFQKTKTGEENIVRAMVNGNPVYVKVHDPEAVKALLGMGNEQVGIVLGAMQKLSNATKRGATGLFAPMFAIKNVGADTIQAAIQSPNALSHLFVDVPTAFISSIGDTFKIPGIGKLAEEFRRAGGEYSGLLKGDRAVNRSLGRLRREPLLSPQGVAKGVYNVGAAPFKALEKIADVTENLNRMAAFNREIRGVDRTPENVRKAISAARESTVNFSRRGAMSQGIEAFVPYQNAAIQSLQRLGTQIIKHPVKTLAGVGTLVVAPKLYEYSQFNDDPDYQKLPARERYRNLIISKNADGTFNKVPMPPEYEAMAAFITDVLNDVVDKDPQAYKGTLSAIADAFTPPIVGGALQGVTQGGGFDQSLKGFLNSTVLAPAVAIAGNQSFTGAPIVPERLKDVSTKYQYDERTSEIAKTIGDKIGLAPLKVDYLIRAYGGDPARLLLPLNSPVGAGTPKQTLLKNFIVDPVFTNTLSNDYFDAKDKYTKAKNDNSNFGAELPAWYDESIEKLLTSQSKGSVSKKLSTLNNDKREVQGDRTLSADAKAQKLRSIQSQINDIYVDVNSQLESSGYKFPNR